LTFPLEDCSVFGNFVITLMSWMRKGSVCDYDQDNHWNNHWT